MSRWNRNEIRKILLECAGKGIGYFGKTQWQLKSDRSLVTEADMEIEGALAGYFDRPDDGIYMIGEETVAAKNEKYIRSAFANTAFIVDPIDGTAPFAHGIPTWGIMIGYMSKGRLEEGGIVLPSTGQLVISDNGVNYISYLGNGGEYSPLKRYSAPKSPPVEGGLISVSQNIVREWNVASTNPLHAVCCSAFSSIYLLMGRYLAFVGCPKLWDVAAVLPILWNAGFQGRLLSGETLDPDVNEKCYHLRRDDKRRWYLRDQMILAANSANADYVESILRKPGKP